MLITEVLRLLCKIWKQGCRYFKVDVMLDGLCPAGLQGGLCQMRDLMKSSRLMDAPDAVNGRYGRGTIRSLSTGLDRTWRAQQNMLFLVYATYLWDITEAKIW
ncbi:DUF4113 domain-containing protein [Komagataeibacter xylinus]|uniref:DUF4113 domain-containing protein n=1 Tax=Komagataeibacter xylinus TaxID=28448 RepID=UPI00280BD2BB|nr:DUF4113 domain-containing protein [Komagataeibacter xylinus]